MTTAHAATSDLLPMPARQVRNLGRASLARSSCVGQHPTAAGNDMLSRLSAALIRSSAGPLATEGGDAASADLAAQPSPQVA